MITTYYDINTFARLAAEDKINKLQRSIEKLARKGDKTYKD